MSFESAPPPSVPILKPEAKKQKPEAGLIVTIRRDVPLDMPKAFVPLPFLNMIGDNYFSLPTDGTKESEKVIVGIIRRCVNELSEISGVDVRALAMPNPDIPDSIRVWRRWSSLGADRLLTSGFGWDGTTRSGYVSPAQPALSSARVVGEPIEVSFPFKDTLRPDLRPVFARMAVGDSIDLDTPPQLQGDKAETNRWRSSLRNGCDTVSAVMRQKSYDDVAGMPVRMWRVA